MAKTSKYPPHNKFSKPVLIAWAQLAEVSSEGNRREILARLIAEGIFDSNGNLTPKGKERHKQSMDAASEPQDRKNKHQDPDLTETEASRTIVHQVENITGKQRDEIETQNHLIPGGQVTDDTSNKTKPTSGSIGWQEEIHRMYWWSRRIVWLLLIFLFIAGFTLSYSMLVRIMPRLLAGSGLAILMVVAGIFLFVQRKKQNVLQYCFSVLTVVTSILSIVPIYERVSGTQLIPEAKTDNESHPKCVLVVLPSAEDHLSDLKQNGGIGDESVSFDIVKGVKEKLQTVATSPSGLGMNVGGENISFLFVNDGPDPLDTVSRIVDQTKKNEVLLILGHETSTSAKKVWTEYYQLKDTPVVLLGPTNPEITKDDSARAKVLLRLMPNDNQQVQRIINVLKEKSSNKSRSVLLVTDSGNPVYSNYIGERIIDRLPRDCEFCGSVQISSVDSLAPDWGRIVKRHHPDTVIFVGMSQAAKSFLLSLHHEAEADNSRTNQTETTEDNSLILDWLENVDFVFTDGCASNGFCSFLKESDLTYRNLYVVSTASTTRDDMTLDRFNFEQVGFAAVAFSFRLLTDAKEGSGRSLLNTEKVLEEVRRHRTPPHDIVELSKDTGAFGSNLRSELCQLQFDEQGDNIKWHWNVFRKVPESSEFIQLGHKNE
ncbi:MAG: hypothetical protein ABL888_07860 [Pirellulaceae bacterium]